MTDATQEPDSKEPNGAQHQVMTPTSADSQSRRHSEAHNASNDAESAARRQKNAPASGTNGANNSDANGRAATGSTTAREDRRRSSVKERDIGSKAEKPKKRRKVNHACLYCRRSHMTCDSERPCTRCVKRRIGHLCHDEPRESPKQPKTDPPPPQQQQQQQQPQSQAQLQLEADGNGPVQQQQQQSDQTSLDDAKSATASAAPTSNLAPLAQNRIANSAPIAQPTPVSGLSGNNQLYPGYDDLDLAAHTQQFNDMHALHPSLMFNTSEVTNEFKFLNDFLSNSLLDDNSGLYSTDDLNGLLSDPSLTNTMGHLASNNALFVANAQQNNQLLPPSQAAVGNSISRPTSGVPIDKAREKYYMTAADPAGTDTPEIRLEKLFKAKQAAGLLKPFNYVMGYQRLNAYLEKNITPQSRQKIARQLDKFRPKFRERMQSLTDIQLIKVEMRFEQNLMEYDRVFASMAIPACCWRRTGEIYRGNKEMAELIKVPIERLRDGKLSIHQIICEASLVSYWEKFGAIAFDGRQKAILTSCSLKCPDDNTAGSEMRCCFSFTIRRDEYTIPSIIVGNFLPMMRDQR